MHDFDKSSQVAQTRACVLVSLFQNHYFEFRNVGSKLQKREKKEERSKVVNLIEEVWRELMIH